MRMWRSLMDLICRNDPLTADGSVEPTTEPEGRCGNEDARDSPESRSDVQDAVDWDQWWKDRLSLGSAETFPMLRHSPGPADMFPMLEAPVVEYRGRLGDVANDDRLLIAIMAEYGLGTVLCAGSGVSQEPRALAAVGFQVTALDVSSTALRVARAFELGSDGIRHFCGPGLHDADSHSEVPVRAGGHVDFVVGNVLDTRVCPGPFDVIIERRMVQRLDEHERSAALEALAGRLSEVGIFLSHCDDNQYPPELGWSFHKTGLFHASESWFRERGWTIWDGAPSFTLAGRVAWLIRSGTMKRAPSGKGDRKSGPV